MKYFGNGIIRAPLAYGWGLARLESSLKFRGREAFGRGKGLGGKRPLKGLAYTRWNRWPQRLPKSRVVAVALPSTTIIPYYHAMSAPPDIHKGESSTLQNQENASGSMSVNAFRSISRR